MAANPIKERWQQWSQRFALLQQREKLMITGAVGVAILFGGYSLWIEPGQLQTVRLKKAIAQQQADQQQLSTQLMVLAQQNTDPDAANRESLKKLRTQLDDADREIKGYESTLVAPTQMPVLLQKLLARHRGLTLVSLNTLPAEPLIKPKDKKDAAAKPEAAPQSPPAQVMGSNIYMHGMELRVAGTYPDLLAYIAEIESSPQQLLWGTMRLVAGDDQPASELTIVFYTLSLEATWLIV